MLPDRKIPISSVSSVRAFRRSLRSLEREIELSLASQTECCGVSGAQCHLLLEIEERGRASIGELAEALELDPSTLSRTTESLVRAGLVSRVDDPANRRRQILELLPEGMEKVANINGLCDEYYEGVLAGTGGAKREALVDSVAYLADAIRERRRGTKGHGS
jgi:DNA-binding MarR family transcriptional regulator